MPRLILAVAASFTRRRKGAMVRVAAFAPFARSTNSGGSPTARRIRNEARAGTSPTTNMPRQPIAGRSSGVTSAAASTPACQPSPT